MPVLQVRFCDMPHDALLIHLQPTFHPFTLEPDFVVTVDAMTLSQVYRERVSKEDRVTNTTRNYPAAPIGLSISGERGEANQYLLVLVGECLIEKLRGTCHILNEY